MGVNTPTPTPFNSNSDPNTALPAHKVPAYQPRWESKIPQRCAILQEPITNVFIDGRTSSGAWGIMCCRCFRIFGTGLGAGKGQKYEQRSAEGPFYRVAG
jgi:hypothetical protein